MKKSLQTGLILLFIFTLIGCTESTIEFPDDGLQTAVLEAAELNKDITTEDAKLLTSIDASEKGIQSIIGIEQLESLETVDLSDNEIEDFTPLLKLENLESLDIIGNFHDDDFDTIELLMEKGVTVHYDDRPDFAETGPPSEGVFYKVEEGNNTVYLFGSIHVGMEEIFPLHDSVEEAFDKADYLAVEIDTTELNGFEVAHYLNQVGTFQDGRTLSNVVPEDLFSDAVDILQGHHYDETMINMLKPWYAAMMISNVAVEDAGYSAEYGIDFYFIERARDNIEIIGLETFEGQLSMFDILTEESQIEYLREVVEEYDYAEEEIGELMEVWRNGDIDALLPHREIDETRSDDYQEYMRALMDDRDYDMTEKIEEFLLDGHGETYFVVVGAMHLVGETSIVGLLEDRGYDIVEGIQ
ncbi:TraB/GumN family protein [Bacillus shivajii]|uniref:TraB/GumN family protein n=1 Tax=Bacillus shivajii TaxID=1983719 RepID=UPI001CF96057|nr:TraB/GumN family protein [Bacillus shivajii]UCZ54005.1 TraB/GumN family protein [Bacillus shivajii]